MSKVVRLAKPDSNSIFWESAVKGLIFPLTFLKFYNDVNGYAEYVKTASV